MASDRRTLFACEDCDRLFQSLEDFSAHNCADNARQLKIPVPVRIKKIYRPGRLAEYLFEYMLNREPPPEGTETGGLTERDLSEDDIVHVLAEGDEITQPSTQAVAAIAEPREDTAVWNRPATLILIDNYRSKQDELTSGRLRKKVLWSTISTKLKAEGFHFTPSQVEGRWKSLMRGLKNIVDHNRRSGNNRRTHPYEEELQFMLVQPHVNVEPNSILSSGASSSTSNTPTPSTSQASTSSVPDTDSATSSPSGTKRKRNDEPSNTPSKRSPVLQVLEVIKGFIETSEKRHEREMVQHDDKMTVLKGFLELMKSNK